MNSIPIALNKAAMRKYEDLEVPCDAILANYVWIDGGGIDLRSKDRTFNFLPKTHKGLCWCEWYLGIIYLTFNFYYYIGFIT